MLVGVDLGGTKNSGRGWDGFSRLSRKRAARRMVREQATTDRDTIDPTKVRRTAWRFHDQEDEMIMKVDTVTYPQSVSVCTDSDWVGQSTTCKSTSGEVVKWGRAALAAWSRTQQSVRLSSAEAELCALMTGIAGEMATKHLMRELGNSITL